MSGVIRSRAARRIRIRPLAGVLEFREFDGLHASSLMQAFMLRETNVKTDDAFDGEAVAARQEQCQMS